MDHVRHADTGTLYVVHCFRMKGTCKLFPQCSGGPIRELYQPPRWWRWGGRDTAASCHSRKSWRLGGDSAVSHFHHVSHVDDSARCCDQWNTLLRSNVAVMDYLHDITHRLGLQAYILLFFSQTGPAARQYADNPGWISPHNLPGNWICHNNCEQKTSDGPHPPGDKGAWFLLFEVPSCDLRWRRWGRFRWA